MALLGCIADDVTGASDLANNLVRRGMTTVQLFGLPDAATPAPDTDAVVVALKSRTAPGEEAVRESLEALAWLQGHGCRRLYFKYCSTFDSTDAGNIGPVAEALLTALESDFTIACPAFPETGRTVYRGHLFVGDVLLSESSLRDHPLTPMTDPNLVRVLARQCAGKVGLVRYDTVAEGVEAVRRRYRELRAEGCRHAITDVISDGDLDVLAHASADLPLVTGGSGLALGLPAAYADAGIWRRSGAAGVLDPVGGGTAILSGSCSEATRAQVAHAQDYCPSYRLDPLALAEDPNGGIADVLDWAERQGPERPVMVYATAEPEAVRKAQERLGVAAAGALVEEVLARIGEGLVDQGVRRFVLAGGETAGAVVARLGIKAVRIGAQIDPGIPWTRTMDEPGLALALKSGNFGAEDFFTKAFEQMP